MPMANWMHTDSGLQDLLHQPDALIPEPPERTDAPSDSSDSRWYLLEGHDPVRTSDIFRVEALLHDREARTVARTTLRPSITVSTVFLCLDHNFTSERPPVLFETMVFGGPLDQVQDRYSFWDEAEAGHAAMVARVQGALDALPAGNVSAPEGASHAP